MEMYGFLSDQELPRHCPKTGSDPLPIIYFRFSRLYFSIAVCRTGSAPLLGNAMNAEHAVELTRAAIFLTLTLSAPVLVVSVLVGLVISLIQAVTQIQEQTLSFVPKIIIMLLTSLLIMPWAIGQMVEYTTALFQSIPGAL